MSNVANTNQILEAFSQLADNELKALSHSASKLLAGTPYSEPSDLIHEALHRALDGRRHWPTDVNFGAFICMTMRSIASSDRERAKAHKMFNISSDDLSDWSGHEQMHSKSAEDAFMEIEQMQIAHKAADAARVGLADDDLALKVLSGMMAGMSAKEMRDEFKLDGRSFDAARHRVMRRISSGMDHGRPN